MPMYNLIEYSSNYSEITGSLWFYYKDEAFNFNADIANDDNFKSFKYKAKLLGNTAAGGANGILRNATIAVPLKYLSSFWRSLEMPLINCKIESKFKWPKYCVFLQLVQIMLMVMLVIMLMLILFLLSKMQNYMFEMPLINCKVESKFKWTKYCVFSAAGANMLMVMLMIMLMVILFLSSKIQNYMLEMPLFNCKVESKFRWKKYCIFSAAGADNVNGNVSDNANVNIIFTIKDAKSYVPIVTLSARDNEKLSKLLSKEFDQFIGMNIKQKVRLKL